MMGDLIAFKRGTLEVKNSNLHDVNMELVNEFSQVPLKRDEVYIRSMYLCNDMIDAYASRFTVEALEEITRLVVGESVMKGHPRSSLPIARFFKAEAVEKDDHNWVRAWFYWLKDTEGALDLAKNIDGRVYREVSIPWRYKTAVCNICHEDIRKCPHIPGDYYSDELCFYEMSEIKEMLDGEIENFKKRKEISMFNATEDVLVTKDEELEEGLTQETLGEQLEKAQNELDQEEADTGNVMDELSPPGTIERDIWQIRNKTSHLELKDIKISKESMDGGQYVFRVTIQDTISSRVALKKLQSSQIDALFYNPQLTVTGQRIDQEEGHGAEEVPVDAGGDTPNMFTGQGESGEE